MSCYPFRATHSLVLALLLVLPAVLEAQNQGRQGPVPAAPVTASAVRISEVPIIDGSLADAAWSGLQPLSEFTQRIPRDGEPATLRTEVRIGTRRRGPVRGDPGARRPAGADRLG